MKNIESLMTVVSENGSGDDIRTLAGLIKQAGNNNLKHLPITQVQHIEENNIYDCIGFTPDKVFAKLAQIERDNRNFTMETQFIEKFIQDQELTEQLAILGSLMMKKLPAPMVGMLLGGVPE